MIRRGTGADVEGLMDLVGSCIAAMRSDGIDQWDDVYPDRETFLADVRSGTLYAATEGARILGCVVLSTLQEDEYAEVPWTFTDGAVGVIYRLMVRPDSQGRGIARELMSFAEARAREEGFAVIRLDAFSKNPRALRFYESLGYRLAGYVTFRKGLFHCYEKQL